MMCLGVAVSNITLLSIFLAKTGGLSWLREVNRIVCVTLMQENTTVWWWLSILVRRSCSCIRLINSRISLQLLVSLVARPRRVNSYQYSHGNQFFKQV